MAIVVEVPLHRILLLNISMVIDLSDLALLEQVLFEGGVTVHGLDY